VPYSQGAEKILQGANTMSLRKKFIRIFVKGIGYYHHEFQNDTQRERANKKLDKLQKEGREIAEKYSEALKIEIRELESKLFQLKEEQKQADRQAFNKRVFVDMTSYFRDVFPEIAEGGMEYSAKYLARKYGA
jgi:hypothetical protein